MKKNDTNTLNLSNDSVVIVVATPSITGCFAMLEKRPSFGQYMSDSCYQTYSCPRDGRLTA